MLSTTQLKRVAVEAGLLTPAEADDALPPLLPVHYGVEGLRSRGLSEDQIAFLVACALQLPFVPVERLAIESAAAERIPLELQVRYRVVPLQVRRLGTSEMIYAAMLPERAAAIAVFLTHRLGTTVVPVVASETSIRKYFDAALRQRARLGAQQIAVCDIDLETPASLDDWQTLIH